MVAACCARILDSVRLYSLSLIEEDTTANTKTRILSLTPIINCLDNNNKMEVDTDSKVNIDKMFTLIEKKHEIKEVDECVCADGHDRCRQKHTH